MRAVIKHLIENYVAIDDEIVKCDNGVISVIAFDVKLATSVASWLVGHMADRDFELKVTERLRDYQVSLVRRN